MFYCWWNLTWFTFLCLQRGKQICASLPLPKESRWDLVQRSCNIQLQTAAEKSGVRESPRWRLREKAGLGIWGEHCPYCIRPRGTSYSACPDFLRRQPGSTPAGECCHHLFSKIRSHKMCPWKKHLIFIRNSLKYSPSLPYKTDPIISTTLEDLEETTGRDMACFIFTSPMVYLVPSPWTSGTESRLTKPLKDSA